MGEKREQLAKALDLAYAMGGMELVVDAVYSMLEEVGLRVGKTLAMHGDAGERIMNDLCRDDDYAD